MKVSCNIIEDLLPLYIDDVCSEESKALVLEHLSTCESCKEKLIAQKSNIAVINDVIKENSRAKKPFKKITRFWIITLVCVAIIIPILFLSINELAGENVGFSALYGRYNAERFLTELEKGDFAGAANHVRFWGPGRHEGTLAEEDEREKWISEMNKLKDEGIMIVSHRKNDISTDDGFTSGNIVVSVRYEDRIYDFNLWVATNSWKVEIGGINYVNHGPTAASDIEDMLISRINGVIVTYDPG